MYAEMAVEIVRSRWVGHMRHRVHTRRDSLALICHPYRSPVPRPSIARSLVDDSGIRSGYRLAVGMIPAAEPARLKA